MLDLKVLKKFESHPLYDIPLVAWATPSKLVVRSFVQKFELDFPHQSPSGTPLSLTWSVMNENATPSLILSHGTQITCFVLEDNQNWLIERIIQLEEICSYVIAFPSTSLILLALSSGFSQDYSIKRKLEIYVYKIKNLNSRDPQTVTLDEIFENLE